MSNGKSSKPSEVPHGCGALLGADQTDTTKSSNAPAAGARWPFPIVNGQPHKFKTPRKPKPTDDFEEALL